ncbi:class I SAM-dependent DNA methyltransferase [Rhizobium lentis]|uniref:Class I SAM-dependent methyltransferase n=1 Tax=Rhizobium lentis TaxID=1138194 RepID=A0ABS7IJS8_9HYPH|nr:class I SAM-dependent methyltransferase [Rhizobium lentis]MBX4972773.1 class I SAM-dependent methyltransferase [Rhizobium lentis]MBX5084909.1 class I SAM-dependent methyltransferase [Rhizobium lentis]MBX5092122.1 class I SAM-dependent methyltransferase [Rhizobium lentis]MBX5096492.1 class I SAM-dependent methyltransferase [Rhizobium lentis]MBX5122046.1 class I SAM-dependent methyltransferase [Rhizobium lentis]
MTGKEQAPIPFGEYSAIYDLIYRDKDYAGEAGFVATLIEQYAPRQNDAPIRVLDLACGTGRHAMELASKGYVVEGSDISSGMVAVARKSAGERGLDLRFHECSFQTADAIPGSFDVVLAMFAALGYLTDFSDFELTLRNVAKKMAPGGIFIFDVWNGAAVLPQYSPHKVRYEADDKRKVERVSRTTLDEVAQQAVVKFEFKVEYADGAVKHFSEDHRVRFYFPQEMVDLLTALGFEVLLRCPFLQPEKAVSRHDWNMTYVVRKRSDSPTAAYHGQ